MVSTTLIYTSYYAMLRHIKLAPVAISLSQPPGFRGHIYTPLQPTYWMFREYKDTNDWDTFEIRYNFEVLRKLDPQKVYKDLLTLSQGNPLVLLCWEKSTCHRFLVSRWLNENGIQCTEWRKE